jgi:glycyl-tRNA synthetase beta chain
MIGVLTIFVGQPVRVPFETLCLKVLLGFDEQYLELIERLQSDARLIDEFIAGDFSGAPTEQVGKLTQGLTQSAESHARLQAILGSRLLIGDAVKTRKLAHDVLWFAIDRLKVQQREAGVRHDLIDAVFATKKEEGAREDDLVRLLARVRALQSFVETPEGADLLAGYKRAANILKKEGWTAASRAMASHEEQSIPQTGEEDPLVMVDDPQLAEAVAAFNERHASKSLSYTPLPEEAQLRAALDSAEPRAAQAVAEEDFEGAMAALATLRAPVDAFFEKVTVNDPDPARREARLDLLARMRDAVHQVADFSRIEG